MLLFRFVYDGNLNHVGGVLKWIYSYETTLLNIAYGLIQRPTKPTLSAYPLMSLTYDSLRTPTEVTLPLIGIDHACSSHVEDIYP